jgi:hypothetical protein
MRQVRSRDGRALMTDNHDRGGGPDQALRRDRGPGRHRPRGSRRGRSSGSSGPTGPGKTTAVRILTTLAVPDSGHGPGWPATTSSPKRPRSVRRNIGVAAQDATLDDSLTGRQNLVMVGELSRTAAGTDRPRHGPSSSSTASIWRRRRPGHEGVLGGHAPSPRPGRQPDDPAARALPRRAHHRPRPHQPVCACGTSSGNSWPTG